MDRVDECDPVVQQVACQTEPRLGIPDGNDNADRTGSAPQHGLYISEYCGCIDNFPLQRGVVIYELNRLKLILRAEDVSHDLSLRSCPDY
jgi:hypothetical protein